MKKRCETIVVNSVDEFLRETRTRQVAWEKTNEWQSDAWFRGVPRADYELSPSFFRLQAKHTRIEEDDLRDEFMRRGLPYSQLLSPRTSGNGIF